MNRLVPSLPDRPPMPGRRVRPIHAVAVLCSLLAAASVFGLFSRFGVPAPSTDIERQLIASVDLRIGNPAGALARGEACARADLEAGLLQLQFRGPDKPPTARERARAQALKSEFGLVWVRKTGESPPLAEAFVEGYNKVMSAEIERRHGRERLDAWLQDGPAVLPASSRPG